MFLQLHYRGFFRLRETRTKISALAVLSARREVPISKNRSALDELQNEEENEQQRTEYTRQCKKCETKREARSARQELISQLTKHAH